MPETDSVRLAISTCPNDTFAFHGLMERKVDLRGLAFEIELMDVQECNRELAAGRFDVAKASFFAALRLSRTLAVLSVGSALGFGVGPVLLAAQGRAHPAQELEGRAARVLCPGEWTTATLLYRLFHGHHGRVEQAVFSDIVPALERGEADFGVCIHEGRFTYDARGLTLVEDLGRTWEQHTRAPLPLGGIMGRLHVGEPTLRLVQAVIEDSLRYARAHPDETLPTMRRYAQELEDDVIRAHVDLYVNDWTLGLGASGRNAIAKLEEQARAAGLIDGSQPPLRVLDA